MKYNITISKEQLLSDSHDDSGYDIVAGVAAFNERAHLDKLSREKVQAESYESIPQSLQAALEKEAKNQNITLDDEAVYALVLRLSDLAATDRWLAVPIIRAFLEVRNGYSADYVVANPELNQKFLERVRQLGGTGTDFELNWTLLNTRKANLISVPTKTRRYTVTGRDEFEFATEMAICHVQKKLERELEQSISLDRIICDPDFGKQFDATAARLAPGYSPIEYRWVVLGLRKARRLSKKAASIECPDFERLGRAIDITPSRITTGQGLYSIRDDNCTLYVGETENLRHRVEHHFESAQGKSLLPDWLCDVNRKDIQLGVLPLDASTRHEFRKALELGCIGKHRPSLNYVCGQSK